jgi:hypothetical protein
VEEADRKVAMDSSGNLNPQYSTEPDNPSESFVNALIAE